eukprot:8895512-Karenia_brevis.AAC.1
MFQITKEDVHTSTSHKAVAGVVRDRPDFRVTAMWILTSSIFLLQYNAYAVVVLYHGIREVSDRAPSHCLPIITC